MVDLYFTYVFLKCYVANVKLHNAYYILHIFMYCVYIISFVHNKPVKLDLLIKYLH